MDMHEGFPVAPRSRANIRAHAANARNVLGLPGGRLNIPRLLDELTEFGIYYDVFDRRDAPVPMSVEACYVPEVRTIYIRDTVFSEMCIGGKRAVFTLGHEIGHAVLAHTRTYNRQSQENEPLYCNSEWQANTFAAEFTMPLAEIKQLKLRTEEQLSTHFGVSAAAAKVRLRDLQKRREI